MNPIPGQTAVSSTPSGASGGEGASPWLKLARDAFSRSTTYLDNNYKKQWERDLRMFQSQHPRDSKYMSESYKYRSRIFRPKSRSVLRKNEATAALAFFSNPDVSSVEPGNPSDPDQVASSVLVRELLQYRLTKSIPWFLTLLGGFQDSMNVGLVCSLQHWRYKEKKVKEVVQGIDPSTGMPISVEVEVSKPIEDKPCVDLYPIEYVRFDPAAQWFDVVATSPYLILQIPMYVNDVLDNMDDAGEMKWKSLDKATILASRIRDLDPLRQARTDGKEDPDTVQGEVNEFDVVMVHLNFVRRGSECNAYYTLEDKHLLTDPRPVGEMFLHCQDGRPPVQIGFCVIETHKPVPTSLIGLTSELQREANEIANQRLDNVKLVLNKRWLVRRGSNADVESLLRNVPGGVTMVNDIERDVGKVDWADVTSSSYQEQDRVNVDFDELAGNFAQGSVLTNRKLNETVGGMRMMAQGANMLTEYTIRVFVETWVEPVLRQLVKMLQAYETDEVVLALAGERAQLFQRFGISGQLDQLLNQELTLNVNVGMGATDPDTRFQRLMQAFGAYAKMVMEGPPDINLEEFRKEVFGLAGFKDAARFFTQVDPRLEHAKKMLSQAQQQAEAVVAAAKDRLASRERALDMREVDLDIKEMELTKGFEVEMQKMLLEFKLAEQKAQLENVIAMQKARQEAGIQMDKAEMQMEIDRQKAEADARLKEFTAKVDAAIKMFMAKVDADAKKKVAAATPEKPRQ